MARLVLTRTLELDRPAAEVHAYLADFSTTEQWDPGVWRAEKRTPGALAAGSTFDLTLRVFGRLVPMQYRLTALSAPGTIVLEGTGPGFTVIDTMRLEAMSATRTRLHYRAEMDLRWAPAVFKSALRPWGERLGDVAMDGLRRALEQDGIEQPGLLGRTAERLVLPGLADYTARGWRRQHSRGLSRRLDGQTVGITGVTSGLGLAAAQLLARLGARLVLVGRDATRLDAAMRAIRDFAGPAELHPYVADLDRLDATRQLADTLLHEQPTLDVWINNAGALFDDRQETGEGHERALAINLLSPALLTRQLAPLLARRNGRLINVVSGGLYAQGLRLDDLQYQQGVYDGSKAYARAKRGLLALTQRWAREPRYAGLTFSAMHPGWAATPGVAKSLPRFDRTLRPWLRDARMGADTMVWLASHPDLAGPARSGQFWFDRASRPTALLPGTAVSHAQAAQLEDWLDRTLGAG